MGLKPTGKTKYRSSLSVWAKELMNGGICLLSVIAKVSGTMNCQKREKWFCEFIRPAGWMMFHYTTRGFLWDVYESKTIT